MAAVCDSRGSLKQISQTISQVQEMVVHGSGGAEIEAQRLKPVTLLCLSARLKPVPDTDLC